MWFSRMSHRRSLQLASLKKLLEMVCAGCLLLGSDSDQSRASRASAGGADMSPEDTHETGRPQRRASNGVEMAAFDVAGRWHESGQATRAPDKRGWEDTARCTEISRWQGRMQMSGCPHGVSGVAGVTASWFLQAVVLPLLRRAVKKLETSQVTNHTTNNTNYRDVQLFWCPGNCVYMRLRAWYKGRGPGYLASQRTSAKRRQTKKQIQGNQ